MLRDALRRRLADYPPELVREHPGEALEHVWARLRGRHMLTKYERRLDRRRLQRGRFPRAAP